MPVRPSQVILRRLAEGPAAATELEQLLGQSQSTVSRALRELIQRQSIIRIGSTRGARYALLRSIAGIGSHWPLRQINPAGRIVELGTLQLLGGNQCHFKSRSSAFAYSGAFEGLPYFLQDQRPAGFLGRAVPQRYPELNLPQRVLDWNDDHYLRYLTQRGSDTVGDLILGDRAFDDYMSLSTRRTAVSADERDERYPQLTMDVLEGGLPGSSAHGEHPKFATLLDGAEGRRHVIVKFSPPVITSVGQRWSDLLVAEHLAHEVLRGGGVQAPQSRIHRFSQRTYLEMDRFDRVGVEGRIGVTSLFAIDAASYGKLDTWIDAAIRLHQDGRIAEQTLETVRLVATFGALIANTDRHFGNLAFIDRYDGQFQLAPIYDMLPMLFAPEHDQLSSRVFTPPGPASDNLRAYGRARALAESYWRLCADEERISDEFRQTCLSCLQALEALPRIGAYAYQEEAALPSS